MHGENSKGLSELVSNTLGDVTDEDAGGFDELKLFAERLDVEHGVQGNRRCAGTHDPEVGRDVHRFVCSDEPNGFSAAKAFRQ
jgi:hypothetical protein